ncbi:N-acetylglucosamine kinase [Microbacterium sp. P04]|uniref:N-acetylglucosamine kinase n=1 Tax=Microbacterium sp. P04 TaxID=3366947 RepID=UPI00374698D4
MTLGQRTRGGWVVGLDIGGSASRASVAPAVDDPAEAPALPLSGERVGISPGGSRVPELVDALLVQAAAAIPGGMAEVRSVAIGATGVRTLVADPQRLVDTLAAQLPGTVVQLSTDAVTAHLGALGGAPGAVVAVGTGSIAFGTDFADVWVRVDGWGHLLGDRGAASWIGRTGLETAIARWDGVDARGERLLAAAIARFGAPLTWPAQLYTRDDRAGVLGSFATDVDALANAGDDAAVAIMHEAGRQVARSVAAALQPGVAPTVAGTGGLFDSAAFAAAFREELGRRAPHAERREPQGSPLDGAVRLARLGLRADTRPRPHPDHLWASVPRGPGEST